MSRVQGQAITPEMETVKPNKMETKLETMPNHTKTEAKTESQYAATTMWSPWQDQWVRESS